MTIVEEPFEFEQFADWNWTGAEESLNTEDSKKRENDSQYQEGNLINHHYLPTKYLDLSLLSQVPLHRQ